VGIGSSLGLPSSERLKKNMKTMMMIAVLVSMATGCAPYYTSKYCFGPTRAPAHSKVAYEASCEMPVVTEANKK
jgi:hypothetical protein